MEPNITSLFIIDLSASASSSRRRRAERSGVQFPPNYPPKDTKPLDTKDTKTFSTQETSRNLLQKPFGSKDTKTFSKQRFWRETLSSRNRKPRPAKSMDNGRRRHRRTKTIPSNFVNDVIPSPSHLLSILLLVCFPAAGSLAANRLTYAHRLLERSSGQPWTTRSEVVPIYSLIFNCMSPWMSRILGKSEVLKPHMNMNMFICE